MTDWHTSVPMWREIAAGNDVKMPDEHEMTLRANEGLSRAVAFWQRMVYNMNHF